MTWHTIREAAERVNRHPETIRRWIRTGQLTTITLTGDRYIRETDLLDCERRHRQAAQATRQPQQPHDQR